MKWYHPFACDNTVKHPFVCDCDNLEDHGFNEWDFLAGKKITKWIDTIIFQAKKKKNNGEPDDVLQNHLMIPVYSERLTRELNKNKMEGIQYLQLKILRANGENTSGFTIANIFNFVEALDLNKSDFSRYQDDFPNPHKRGQIARIRRYVLIRKKLHGLYIVRLKDYTQAF
jgi:hypothetical protein